MYASTQTTYLYNNVPKQPHYFTIFYLNYATKKTELLDKNYIKITQEPHAFIFSSTNPEKVWFMVDKKKASTAQYCNRPFYSKL